MADYRPYGARWWLDFVVIAGLVLVTVLGYALPRAFGGDREEAAARAAIALAQAKREREAKGKPAPAPEPKPAPIPTACHEDTKAAVDEHLRTGKPLVVWVGLRCQDHPEFRAELADAVHVHMARQNDDPTPRVVVAAPDGTEFYVRPANLTKQKAGAVKRLWARPGAPMPGARAKVIEEVRVPAFWPSYPPPRGGGYAVGC